MPPPPNLRIASLLAGSTEILYGLGLGDQVVAISHECDFPPDAVLKPRVTLSRIDADANSLSIDEQVKRMTPSGEALYAIDSAKLIALKPDLTVTQSHCDVCAVRHADVVALVQASPSLAGTQIVAMNPTRLDELFDDIDRIAVAAGATDCGRAYVSSLKNRLDVVARMVQNREHPRVVCIEWIEPLMVAANWLPDLIDRAGGRCEMTKAGEYSTYTNWCDLLAYDPDVIVVSPCGFDLARTRIEAKVLADRSEWRQLMAVRSNRVFAVDGNAYFNRAGPRLIDSVELLASIIHQNEVPPGAAGVRLS
jgi:iron complex transport system substrate-binding protein